MKTEKFTGFSPLFGVDEPGATPYASGSAYLTNRSTHMALWDKSESSPTTTPTSSTPASQPSTPVVQSQPARSVSTSTSAKSVDTRESIIASGLTIEGKINGKGNVRVAGKFKGDIQVEGDLHIDTEARVEGQVKAGEVIVNGELQGNVDSAKRVELKQGSMITGDIKAGSLTVESGARMRGNVDCGFEESKKA